MVVPVLRGAPKKPEPKLTVCRSDEKEDEEMFSVHSRISNEVMIRCVWDNSGCGCVCANERSLTSHISPICNCTSTGINRCSRSGRSDDCNSNCHVLRSG